MQDNLAPPVQKALPVHLDRKAHKVLQGKRARLANLVKDYPARNTWVGGTTCSGCHTELYETFMKSGHPWKLNKIEGGQPPDYPFRNLSNPPEGYTWDDISYVIAGYWWKAGFIDQEGYIITDAPGQTGNTEYLNQYNHANEELDKDAGWVTFKSGTEKLVYDCGACQWRARRVASSNRSRRRVRLRDRVGSRRPSHRKGERFYQGRLA